MALQNGVNNLDGETLIARGKVSLSDLFAKQRPDSEIIADIELGVLRCYSFFEVRGLLEKRNLSENVRAALGGGIDLCEFYEVEKFLRDDAVPIEVRFSIIKRLKSHTKNKKNILDFISNRDINAKVRKEIAQRKDLFELNTALKTLLLSPTLESFIAAAFFEGLGKLDYSEHGSFIRSFITNNMLRGPTEMLIGNISLRFDVDTFFGKLDLKPVHDLIRSYNIEHVNSAQYDISTLQNKQQLDLLDPKKRSLVFYYRGIHQGAFPPHYMIMLKFLKKYIEQGYSGLFNRFIITSRYEDDYPAGFPENYIYCEKDHFRNLCSLYSDAIHLNHGTPQPYAGSIPVIGLAMASDKMKMRKMGDAPNIILPLLYYGKDNMRSPGFDKRSSPVFPDLPIEEILMMLLKSIQDLENIHIQTTPLGKIQKDVLRRTANITEMK